jgi:hypothetical protein
MGNRWTLREVNLVLSKEKEKGGHFAAYEVLDSLVSDLRETFGRVDQRLGL